MVAYHDHEWGRPSADETHLFEMLCLEGAQAGLSWQTILRKREGYRKAFSGFDAVVVARYGEADEARLFADLAAMVSADRVHQRRAQVRARLGHPVPASEDRGKGILDVVIDVRAVFQQDRRDLAVGALPAVLLPRKGPFGLVDHEKAFCPDPADDVFDARGIDRDAGCMVLVRPDQYVAHVLPLDEHQALTDFLTGILVDADGH